MCGRGGLYGGASLLRRDGADHTGEGATRRKGHPGDGVGSELGDAVTNYTEG